MKENVDILITKGIVITMNDDRQIIKDGSIVIEKDKIVDVGKSAEIEEKYKGNRVVNAKGKVVLPGLIGPHVHLDESLPRGFMDDMNWSEPGPPVVRDRLYPYKSAMGREDVYYSSLLANLEMIKSGMTCFCDPAAHPQFYDESFRTTDESGIRGVITRSNITMSPSAFQVPSDTVETPDNAIKNTVDMIERWQGRGEGRLRPWLGVRHIMTAKEEFIMKTAEEYRRLSGSLGYRIGIKAHAAFVRRAVEEKIKQTGKREVEWLDSLGVLGPQWLLAHAYLLSDKEVELIEKHDVKIVHCPGANFHSSGGAGRSGKFLEMLDKGITVAIAPDAGWCNNNLDMFLEMRHVAYMHKNETLDGSVLPAETALEMATLNGAKAVLWEDEIGSLKPGMKADIIMLDPWRPNSIPLHDHNIVKNLVYATYCNQVDTVICNGKIIMENREVKTLNEEDIMKKSQELAEGVVTRHPLKVESQWPIV